MGKRITSETGSTFSWIRKRMKTGGADGTLMGQWAEDPERTVTTFKRTQIAG